MATLHSSYRDSPPRVNDKEVHRPTKPQADYSAKCLRILRQDAQYFYDTVKKVHVDAILSANFYVSRSGEVQLRRVQATSPGIACKGSAALQAELQKLKDRCNSSRQIAAFYSVHSDVREVQCGMTVIDSLYPDSSSLNNEGTVYLHHNGLNSHSYVQGQQPSALNGDGRPFVGAGASGVISPAGSLRPNDFGVKSSQWAAAAAAEEEKKIQKRQQSPTEHFEATLGRGGPRIRHTYLPSLPEDEDPTSAKTERKPPTPEPTSTELFNQNGEAKIDPPSRGGPSSTGSPKATTSAVYFDDPQPWSVMDGPGSRPGASSSPPTTTSPTPGGRSSGGYASRGEGEQSQNYLPTRNASGSLKHISPARNGSTGSNSRRSPTSRVRFTDVETLGPRHHSPPTRHYFERAKQEDDQKEDASVFPSHNHNNTSTRPSPPMVMMGAPTDLPLEEAGRLQEALGLSKDSPQRMKEDEEMMGEQVENLKKVIELVSTATTKMAQSVEQSNERLNYLQEAMAVSAQASDSANLEGRGEFLSAIQRIETRLNAIEGVMDGVSVNDLSPMVDPGRVHLTKEGTSAAGTQFPITGTVRLSQGVQSSPDESSKNLRSTGAARGRPHHPSSLPPMMVSNNREMPLMSGGGPLMNGGGVSTPQLGGEGRRGVSPSQQLMSSPAGTSPAASHHHHREDQSRIIGSSVHMPNRPDGLGGGNNSPPLPTTTSREVRSVSSSPERTGIGPKGGPLLPGGPPGGGGDKEAISRDLQMAWDKAKGALVRALWENYLYPWRYYVIGVFLLIAVLSPVATLILMVGGMGLYISSGAIVQWCFHRAAGWLQDYIQSLIQRALHGGGHSGEGLGRGISPPLGGNSPMHLPQPLHGTATTTDGGGSATTTSYYHEDGTTSGVSYFTPNSPQMAQQPPQLPFASGQKQPPTFATGGRKEPHRISTDLNDTPLPPLRHENLPTTGGVGRGDKVRPSPPARLGGGGDSPPGFDGPPSLMAPSALTEEDDRLSPSPSQKILPPDSEGARDQPHLPTAGGDGGSGKSPPRPTLPLPGDSPVEGMREASSGEKTSLPPQSSMMSKKQLPLRPEEENKINSTSTSSIMIMGAGAVGKTCITSRAIEHKHFIVEYDPTEEKVYPNKAMTIDGTKGTFVIYDTAGQEEMGATLTMQESYLRQGEGFVFVYSIVDRSSFEKVKTLFATLRRCKGKDVSIPCVFVGCKLDLQHARAVPTTEGSSFAEMCGAAFMEISATDLAETEEVFVKIIREIRTARKKNQNAGVKYPSKTPGPMWSSNGAGPSPPSSRGPLGKTGPPVSAATGNSGSFVAPPVIPAFQGGKAPQQQQPSQQQGGDHFNQQFQSTPPGPAVTSVSVPNNTSSTGVVSRGRSPSGGTAGPRIPQKKSLPSSSGSVPPSVGSPHVTAPALVAASTSGLPQENHTPTVAEKPDLQTILAAGSAALDETNSPTSQQPTARTLAAAPVNPPTKTPTKQPLHSSTSQPSTTPTKLAMKTPMGGSSSGTNIGGGGTGPSASSPPSTAPPKLLPKKNLPAPSSGSPSGGVTGKTPVRLPMKMPSR